MEQNYQEYRTYKYGLFDCCENCMRCLYVIVCSCCAIADLSVVIDPCCMDNKVMRWWFMMLLNAIVSLITVCIEANTKGVANIILGGVAFVYLYIVVTSSSTIADRIGYQREECGCGCCITYWCCFPCKVCQIANQLDVDPATGNQCRGTVELCTEINEITLIKNCFCEVTNPAPEYYNQQQPAAIYVQPAAEEVNV